MAAFLVDSTGLLDASKGVQRIAARIRSLIVARHEVAVCAINITEFYSGILPQDRTAWDPFFQELAYWRISPSAALQAGIWRYEYRLRGIQLSVPDTIVAAVAVEHRAVLLTSNVRHFPMSEVTIEALRA